MRDVLLLWWAVLLLPVSLRAFTLARLRHGEGHYGAPLCEGWGPAAIESRQEIADALAYFLAQKRWFMAILIGLLWRLL